MKSIGVLVALALAPGQAVGRSGRNALSTQVFKPAAPSGTSDEPLTDERDADHQGIARSAGHEGRGGLLKVPRE